MSTPVTSVTIESLTEACSTKLGATHVEGKDISGGCGQNFEIKIVSPMFEGKSTLQKHRMVNEALKDQIALVHAFSQKSFTPAQWEALQQQ
ncbi:bola protein [Linnemannia elongata]|nr:bola protein [Linnemannia elongata]